MAPDRTVLILGARGMLGHALRDILAASWKVEGADIDDVDIARPGEAERFIGARRPFAVINAAARTDVDGCERDPEGAFAVNGRGAGNVARGCAAAGARLVHLSTDYVFDGLARRPYREDAPTDPQSVYGRSKRAGEEAVFRALPGALIVRTSWLFGAHGRNFVDTILGAAAAQSVIEVVGDQLGCPTYSRDLAAALGALLGAGCSGIVHVANSGVCSWCDYARSILRIAGIGGVRVKEIASDMLGRPAKRPPFSALDCGRYASIAGAPLRCWRDAVAEYLRCARGSGGGRSAGARRHGEVRARRPEPEDGRKRDLGGTGRVPGGCGNGDSSSAAPHYLGHRRRLKDKYLAAGADALQDYELLELLLTYAIPRRDVKPLAKELMRRFGSLGGIFDARREELRQVRGIGAASSALLSLISELCTACLAEGIRGRDLLSSPRAVGEFARAKLAGGARENFMVIFLNVRNEVIDWEVVNEGTLDRAVVYPRTIIEKALARRAAGMILVHNHPSGHPEPSVEDKQITRSITEAARTMDLRVIDHMVVGKKGFFSFAEHNLI